MILNNMELHTALTYLSITLEIDVTESNTVSDRCTNLIVPPDAKLEKIGVKIYDEHLFDVMEDCNETDKQYREWIAYPHDELYMLSNHDEDIKRYVQDKGFFTFKDMYDTIIDFEKEDRLKGKWFGGIDVQHVCVDGIYNYKKQY